MKGKVNRTTCLDGVLTKPEAHQSEGGLLLLCHFNVEMATAQFRFDTPTACGGELHSDPLPHRAGGGKNYPTLWQI